MRGRGAGETPERGDVRPGPRAAEYWRAVKYHGYRAHATVSYRIASAGVAIVVLLYLVAAWLTNQTGPVDLSRFYTPLFASVFIGMATGHYAGRLLKADGADGAKRLSLFIGVYGTLTAVALVELRASIPTGILVTSFYLVFVVHDGGLVSEDGAVEHWVSLLSGRVATYGLVLLAVLHYSVPVATATTSVIEQVVDVIRTLPV